MRRLSILSIALGMTAGVALTLALGRVPRAAAEAPAPAPAAAPASPAMRVITADTDPTRIETIHITHSEKPKLVPCFLPPAYEPQKCLKVLTGPFVVTDVTHATYLSMFVGADAEAPSIEGFVPRWRVYLGSPDMYGISAKNASSPAIHGGRYAVRAGEVLFVADPPVKDFRTFTVSGFRPY